MEDRCRADIKLHFGEYRRGHYQVGGRWGLVIRETAVICRWAKLQTAKQSRLRLNPLTQQQHTGLHDKYTCVQNVNLLEGWIQCLHWLYLSFEFCVVILNLRASAGGLRSGNCKLRWSKLLRNCPLEKTQTVAMPSLYLCPMLWIQQRFASINSAAWPPLFS